MAELTNGTLVAAVRERITKGLAETGQAPGRRTLAAELDVTEYRVRRALDTLEAERATADEVQVLDQLGANRPSRAPTSPPAGRPVGYGGRDRATPGEPAGEVGRPAGEVGDEAGRHRATVGAGRANRWPLLLLALPAFVAIWGGWVGLGRLVGFGRIELLPGIWDGLVVDSAITLPIGLETYAAYALHVWLSGRAPTRRARVFAKVSALASLGLGAAGQVAYHLMTAAGLTVAPWGVTAAVATLPVAVLGMGAALAHLVAHHRPVGHGQKTSVHAS